MRVLNIDVPPDLAKGWAGWYAPTRQPFVVPRDTAAALGLDDDRAALTPELRDRYSLYGLDADDAVVWLDHAAFRALDPQVRARIAAAQPERHRWPAAGATDRMVRWVAEGCRPSRHDEVADATWDRAAARGLPRARELAGTFPASSGPNCLGTVMAAAGVDGAERVWMQREPFERWLRERATPLARDVRPDDEPGTLLVWRSGDGQVEHAAVTLGDGWALQKRSQGWFSPVEVLAVPATRSSARAPGRRLRRYRLDVPS